MVYHRQGASSGKLLIQFYDGAMNSNSSVMSQRAKGKGGGGERGEGKRRGESIATRVQQEVIKLASQ